MSGLSTKEVQFEGSQQLVYVCGEERCVTTLKTAVYQTHLRRQTHNDKVGISRIFGRPGSVKSSLRKQPTLEEQTTGFHAK